MLSIWEDHQDSAYSVVTGRPSQLVYYIQRDW